MFTFISKNNVDTVFGLLDSFPRATCPLDNNIQVVIWNMAFLLFENMAFHRSFWLVLFETKLNKIKYWNLPQSFIKNSLRCCSITSILLLSIHSARPKPRFPLLYAPTSPKHPTFSGCMNIPIIMFSPTDPIPYNFSCPSLFLDACPCIQNVHTMHPPISKVPPRSDASPFFYTPSISESLLFTTSYIY